MFFKVGSEKDYLLIRQEKVVLSFCSVYQKDVCLIYFSLLFFNGVFIKIEFEVKILSNNSFFILSYD